MIIRRLNPCHGDIRLFSLHSNRLLGQPCHLRRGLLYPRDARRQSSSTQPISHHVKPDQGQQPSIATPTHRSSPRRSLRPLIYAAAFLFVGLTAGQLFRLTILPPPLPIPSSGRDLKFIRALNKDADRLPIVQDLRSHTEEWSEHEAYSNHSHAEKETSLSAGVMRGSRGLGVQRQFWHEKEGRIMTIVFLGGALAGWPGVTHGGVVATIMEENMERVASRNASDKQGVAQRLEVKYIRPTHANRFYIIRAEPDESKFDVSNGQSHVKAQLEDAKSGAIYAEATSSFTIP